MPRFEYTAIDRQGNSVQGHVDAATRDEAALNLTRTGLLVSRLIEGAAQPPSIAQPARATASPSAAAVARPTAGPSAVRAPVSRPAPVAAQARKPVIRTKRGSDKDIYFVFSQLQSYAKAGANPVEALTNLGNNCPRQDYKQALLEAADAAKEGKPISDVFERYIDLFPPHVVGMTRAAEQGGFFPEAYDFVTDQAHASHKFRIWFTWLWAVTIMVAACLPLTWLLLRGAVASWDAQEASGGTAPGWSTFFGSVWKVLVWPCGPVILALVIAWILFSRTWQALPMREKRHRLALLVPSVNKRAKAESIAVFSWTMGMLAKVGLPPKTVWDLSTATMPNLEMRKRLEDTGRRMNEQTKLSEAMKMTQQLPEEYAPIVQTGEITGDVPGALARASSSQLEEFKAGDQATKMRVGCWMLLVMGLGSAIMFGMFYGGFMGEMVQKLTGE